MNKKSLSVLLSFLLIWVLFTAPAWAGQVVTDEVKAWAKGAIEQEKALKTVSAPNTVAVLYFSNKTGWSDLDILQKGLTLMLITDLSKVEEIQVVERVKVQALVEELDLEVSGLVKPSTSSQMGKLLGVELLVGGDILKGKIEELFQLKSNLLKVQTEKVVGWPWTEGELLAELFRMEKELLFEIIKELKIELSPELEAELKKPLTTNLTALLYLFEGIDHSDRGNYSKAAESYKKAMAEDPNFGQAEAFLWELQALNLWAGAIEAYSEPEGGGTSDDTIDELPDDRDLTEREAIDSIDSDGDGTPDGDDGCPSDPNKIVEGTCGCGFPDTDSDGDGTPDCIDECPNDPNKIAPGVCGCGVADTDSDGDGVPDCDDGCPNDPNKIEPGICGCGVPEGCYSQGDPPPVVDESSVIEAYKNISNNDELQKSVENGDFIPGYLVPTDAGAGYQGWSYNWTEGVYTPGLQTVGVDEKGNPTHFLSEKNLAWTNDDPFLAYAVQVEEDRLNREILEMHRDAAEGKLLDIINWQLASGDIRTRDDFLMQQADAQAGRVLKDVHGNWVRVQQYILRPNVQTVQVLNVCLRGAGAGSLAGLSTIDWTTTFTATLPSDLRSLPWNVWLDTQGTYPNRYVWNLSSVDLKAMYVRFTNPANESLREFRGFLPNNDGVQPIETELLTINDSTDSYVYVSGTPSQGRYTIDSISTTNPGVFNYVLGDGRSINVSCYIVGDIDTVASGGSLGGIYDIWDALRVNEGLVTGDPNIGNNNLEICIDNGANTNIFSNPIDVVYIPMSRMLWKIVPQ